MISFIFRVEKNAQSRIDQIAEVIAELKDPMTEPAAALEPEQPMDISEPVIDQKLIRRDVYFYLAPARSVTHLTYLHQSVC